MRGCSVVSEISALCLLSLASCGIDGGQERVIALNEKSTRSRLIDLYGTQKEMKARSMVDHNKNGVGEYLNEKEVTRYGYWDSRISLDGTKAFTGYYYHLIIPKDDSLAETRWCCVAWPERTGKTGRRSFMIDQSGRFFEITGKHLSHEKPPTLHDIYVNGDQIEATPSGNCVLLEDVSGFR